MSGQSPKPLLVPIQRIVLVDEFGRPERGEYRSASTPGHLIHIVESGEVTQVAEGRPEAFRAGAVVWYHECEPIKGRVLRAPWRFISINFIAPALAPPRDDRRVLPAGPQTLILARRLLALWRDRSMPAMERDLRCVGTLAELLLDFMPLGEVPPQANVYPRNAVALWWRVEKQLRERLDEPADLRAIARLAGLSVRTTIRACKAATGQPPIQRLRDLRLAYAHTLLHYSDLSVTDIAFRIGYARVQEFSRDFRRYYGCTPRTTRTLTPTDHCCKPRHRP